MRLVYPVATAMGCGIGAWAIKKAIELPITCAPTKAIYDQCYSTAIASLGGPNVFDPAGWPNGLQNMLKASNQCHIQYQELARCMNYVPHIVTAVISTAIVIFALMKCARH